MAGKSSKKAIQLAKGITSRNRYADGGRPITPQSLAANISPIEDNYNPDYNQEVLGQYLQGKFNRAVDLAKMPGDVLAGNRSFDPRSDADIADAVDLAGFAQTGGMGGVSARTGDTVLGSGPIRQVASKTEQIHPIDMSNQIADLLKQGRYKEITNEMLFNADHPTLTRLYNEGATGEHMPMDYESRMGRASEMGYDQKRYRGIRGDEADNYSLNTDRPEGKMRGTGSWLSSDPDIAATYTGNISESPATLPLLVQSKELKNIPWKGEVWSYGPKGKTTDEVGRAVRNVGVKGVNFNDIVDVGPHLWNRVDHMKRLPNTSTTTMVVDPSIVRSPFALFDPRLNHLTHLNRKDGGSVDSAVDIARKHYAVGGSPFYGQDVYNQLMADIAGRKTNIPVGQFDLYKGAKGTAPVTPKGTTPGGQDPKIIPPTDGSSGTYDGGGSGGSEQTGTSPDGPTGSYGQNKAEPIDIHDPNAVIDLNTPTPATIGSATSYDKASGPRDQGTMTAPKGGPIESYDLAPPAPANPFGDISRPNQGPPAPVDVETKSVQTTSVAPTDQFAGMYNGTPPAAKADVETDKGVSIANTARGAAQLEAEMAAKEAQEAKANQEALGAQIGAQVGPMLGAQAPKADVETDRGVSIANTPKGVSQLEGRDMLPGVQAPTVAAPPAFATAAQLENPNPSYTMGAPHAESISAYSYGTLNEQNQQAQNTLNDISRGLDAFGVPSQTSVSVADPSSLSKGMQDALNGLNPDPDAIQGMDDMDDGDNGDDSADGEGGDDGGEGSEGGGSDSSGDSGGGSDGGGGGGDGGGGEKRGGFIRLKNHIRPNEAAIKKALKIASKHTKSKNKTIAKKPSVVK
jgi:uncharacterized membrane protein YgcG